MINKEGCKVHIGGANDNAGERVGLKLWLWELRARRAQQSESRRARGLRNLWLQIRSRARWVTNPHFMHRGVSQRGCGRVNHARTHPLRAAWNASGPRCNSWRENALSSSSMGHSCTGNARGSRDQRATSPRITAFRDLLPYKNALFSREKNASAAICTRVAVVFPAPN